MAIPTQDQSLKAWSENFGTRISATPLVFGLSAGMATEFDSRYDAYVAELAALTLAREAGVRSEPQTAAKDQKKRLLLDYGRDLYRIVQGMPGLTDEQLIELGVNPTDRIPTPVPPPNAPPAIGVVSVIGRDVRLSIKDASGTRKGRPLFVAGCSLFSFVGPTAPEGTEGWQAEGNITRNSCIVQFPVTVPGGSKVWFTGFWYTQRGLSGPACTPIFAGIGYDSAEPLAA